MLPIKIWVFLFLLIFASSCTLKIQEDSRIWSSTQEIGETFLFQALHMSENYIIWQETLSWEIEDENIDIPENKPGESYDVLPWQDLAPQEKIQESTWKKDVVQSIASPLEKSGDVLPQKTLSPSISPTDSKYKSEREYEDEDDDDKYEGEND